MSLADSKSLPDNLSAGQKQPANVYTVMLIIAFVALVIGSIFLYLEMRAYEMQIKVPSNEKASSVAAPQAHWVPSGLPVLSRQSVASLDASGPYQA